MNHRIVLVLMLFGVLAWAEIALARAGGAPGGAPAGAPAGAPSGAPAAGAPGPSGSTGAPAAGAPAAGDNSAATTGPGDGLGGVSAGVSQDPRLYRSPASLPVGGVMVDDPSASPRGTTSGVVVAPGQIAPNTPLMCPGINAWDPRRC
jgi:hypothetical protein